MRYLIFGAGGAGGALGGQLARAGREVTFLARGAHLAALQTAGLEVERPDGTFRVPAAAVDPAAYGGGAEVIFVCVKGYSLAGTVPVLRRAAGPETVVIPILNLYGTGERLQAQLPAPLVTDGCIYVASELAAPGRIRMRGSLLRVVFGVRSPAEDRPVLREIEADLNAAGVRAVLSDDIRRDALKKFAYVSPQGACGAYYGIPAGPMQQPGAYRDCFAALVGEIGLLAEAMGIRLGGDVVQESLRLLDTLAPEMTTSLQRDLARGGPSEVDGLIFEVVRMGERLGVPVPAYSRIAAALAGRDAGRA